MYNEIQSAIIVKDFGELADFHGCREDRKYSRQADAYCSMSNNILLTNKFPS